MYISVVIILGLFLVGVGTSLLLNVGAALTIVGSLLLIGACVYSAVNSQENK